MFSVAGLPGQAKPLSARPIRRPICDVAIESQKTSQASQESPDDLLHLEDFNDNELLRALWVRYERKEIFTWVGNVLVSLNPYRDIQAFTEECASRYASNNPPEAPHLFATVKAALTAEGDRHALLITGESGAGKTEATRAVLFFLAMRQNVTDVNPSDYLSMASSAVKDRLLRSTPVLEAFGNAHTRQNANSSRFGKFIEVHLSRDLDVVGATLQPYMLEASRVAGDLPPGERTYHVFYLLRAALSAIASGTTPQGPFWTRLTTDPEWMELACTSGKALAASPRLDNGPSADRCLEQFEALHEGLVKVGMRPSEVADCCRIIAAVSLLADTSADESVLAVAAGLLRVPKEELHRFLSKAEMSVGSQKKERLLRNRSEREATTLRASFAQELYASLFGWVTRLVARGIAPPAEHLLDGGRALGLLDLYGFEVFPTNGFEQFLINYCNERLQQFFNQQVFTKEAEEYAAEGLDSDGQWRRFVSACQLPALALLEGEPGSSCSVGAFGVINDHSRCGFEDARQDGGSALAQAVASACGQHPSFRTYARDSSRVFGIAHFAGEVFYEAAQFQRKNASAHRPDIVAFLKEKGDSFVHEVVTGDPDTEARDEASLSSTAPAGNRRKLFGRTLISVFREELNELCSALEARVCRHVRCLRPNDQQAPMVFDDASMLRQCRYSGLLEATRIRRQGYAHRRPLRSFAARFTLLLGTREARRLAWRMLADTGSNSAVVCNAICQAASANGISAEDATIGLTKVFLRENALVFFEKARFQAASCIIMALLRGHHTRQWYCRHRRAAVVAQSIIRGRQARVFVRRLRAEIRAAEDRVIAERYSAEIRAAEEAAALAEHEALQAAMLARAVCASCVLQRWWRQRCARVSSMVAAVRREQEHLRIRGSLSQQWAQPDDIVVLLSSAHNLPTSPGPSRVVSPDISLHAAWPSAANASTVSSPERVPERTRGGEASARSSGRFREDSSPRKPCTVTTRTNRPPKDSLEHKKQEGRQKIAREVPSRVGSLRTSTSQNLQRGLTASIQNQGNAGSRPPSPRTLRRCYRQEIARLLAQHRQLRQRLPPELRGLPAQLMEAAHSLGHNGPPVPLEVLAHIHQLLQTLKAALKEHPNVRSYYPMPDCPCPSSQVQQRQVCTGDAVTRSYPGGLLVDNRASAPALLQQQHSWTPSYSYSAPMSSPHSGTYPCLAQSHSGPITYAPPLDEQPRGLRQSVSARSTLRHMSPLPAPSRSPQRTLPATAGPPTRRFHTPVRARSPTAQVSTPIAQRTPRHVCHTVLTEVGPATPTTTPTSVKHVWAWNQPCATVATVQAVPTAQVTSVAIPCTTPTSCRMRSPGEDKARDPLQPSIRIMSLPTPMRKHLTSPCEKVRTPLMLAAPTATTVSAATSTPILDGSGKFRSAFGSTATGSARMPGTMCSPATGSAQAPVAVPTPTASPRASPVSTPKGHKVPGPPLFRVSKSSPALVCSLAERLKQAQAAQSSAMDWRSNPKVGNIGPSRGSSPPPLPA